MNKETLSVQAGRKVHGISCQMTWERENQTEFYRLYAKMIPRTAEIGDDLHEDFVATLVFEEEQMIEGKAKVIDVTNETEMGKYSQKPTQCKIS